MPKKVFYVGELVTVTLPSDDTDTATKPLRPYNNTTHKISNQHMIGNKLVYELEGCVGKKDIPYWFISEWLRKYKGGI